MESTERISIAKPGATRRSFFKHASAALGLAGAGLLAAADPVGLMAQSSSTSGPTAVDLDIVNFALNLEYLEAEFYTVATTGKTIEQVGIGVSGTGTQGATTGGQKVTFGDKERENIAREIAFDERAHVTLLRKLLGKNAIAKPAIDLDALKLGFGSETEFLTLARAFEDVGVTAYAGAAPLLTDKDILAVAARILATEAEHSGNIRLQTVQLEIDGGAIGALDDLDVVPRDWKYFSVSFQGLVFTRTPRQVLDIVLGGKGNTSGGFFPNGVNGDVTPLLSVKPGPEWL